MSLHPPIAPNSPPAAPPALAMGPRVGILLRRAREERRQSVADVAAALCIRANYLEAIEAGAYERLPGQAYIVGFVRSYANYLGLDAGEAVRVFKREGQGFDPAPASLAMPAPITQRSIPGGRVLVTGVVLAICGYGVWSYLGGRQGGDTVAPVPTALSGDATPSEAKAAVRDQAAQVAAVPASPATRQPAAMAPGQPSAPASSAAARSAPARPTPVAQTAEPVPPATTAPRKLALAGTGAVTPAASPAATPSPSPAQPGHVFGAADGPARIELRFTGDCWIQVRGPGSDLSSGKLMHAGDVYRVPDHPDLALRVGNTDAMSIALDGKPVTLPRGRSLVQTIALDPSRLAAGTAEIVASHRANAELAPHHTDPDDADAHRQRADRAAAAAATAAAARNPPALTDDPPPPRPRPVRVSLPPAGPPLGALSTPPPPPNQPPPPDDND